MRATGQWKAFIGAAAIALSLAAFGAAASAQPAAGVVRVGTDVDAQSLDPRLQRETTGYRVINLVYSGLVQLDAQLNPVADLAERWENPDPRTWIFHLRRNAKFHDGRPVTAADVVFTYRTILDPALNARFRSLYTPIDAIEASDDFTVRIRLKEPYAPLLSYLDLGIVPKHLVDGGRDLNTQPVGSGPFRFVRWDRGSRIVLEANPDYFGGRPRVNGIEFVVVADNTARAQALEAGDLQIIQSPLSPRDIQRLDRNQRFVHAALPGLGVTYLNFNARNENLADPRMRRALAMLVDQNTIVNQIYEGTDQVAGSVLIPSLAWAFDASVRQPGFDVNAAKALFTEMGWRPGADGILARNGRRLQVTLSTHSEDPSRVQSVEFIQNVMRQAGVDVRVQVTDWPPFNTGVQQGRHEVALLGWLLLVDPDRLLYAQLHSQGSLNWGGYNNPQVDQALERGRSALNQADRAAAYRDAARILAQEVPYYIISYQGFHVFTARTLEGFRPDPRGYLRSLAAN
ncbi:MAG: ABC transporter substrate-binding protein [Alphaproteobacteria bacterium]|nr:ABC transporter substrate-binding protein [Alphaproteobacteria bacterium]